MERKAKAITAARQEADAEDNGNADKAEKVFKKLKNEVNRDFKQIKRKLEAEQDQEDDGRPEGEDPEAGGACSVEMARYG